MVYKRVGQRLPDECGELKVTGKAIYASDVKLPGMLYGKILRSPYAHARILEIDISEALGIPGVEAVITGDDTKKINYLVQGPPFDDKPVLAVEKVRYIGDEVAAVAAVDERTALKALRAIKVTYEPLPHVTDPHQAMAPGAPVIHEPYPDNVASHYDRKFGDVERGFLESDFIFENTYKVPAQSHCCMEPRACVASYDEATDSLDFWTATQSPYFVRKEIAHVLDTSPSKVRVREVFLGGGFGARSKVCEDEGICALLSIRTRRPVKITYSRKEELTATRIRHPMEIRIKTGVKKDGALVAREVDILTDNGAYSHAGPAVMGVAGSIAASLYRVPNVRVHARLVHTNKHYGGPFRGYGNPQMTFAIESQLDLIAKKLGVDPMDLRLKNANLPGETSPCGWKMNSCSLKECLEKAREEIGWDEKKRSSTPGRGLGVACLVHASGFRVYVDGDFSSVLLKLNADGFITIYSGIADIGTMSRTALKQIVAESLDYPMEKIRIITMDTEITPIDLGAWGSRTLYLAGKAAEKAAADAKRILLNSTSRLLGLPAEELILAEGSIRHRERNQEICSFSQAILASDERLGQAIYAKGYYESETEMLNKATGIGNISEAYTFAAQACEVEVDEQTGIIKPLLVVAVHDVGVPINPLTVEGQIEGAVAQGLGYGIMENHIYDESGRVINDSFNDYKIPTTMDVPVIKAFMEGFEPAGPFGAKSVGEPGLVGIAPAIANAVLDATGVQIAELPLSPERVFWAIKNSREE